MAEKKAKVVIDVDDKSLTELNTEIQALEESISNLKIGTKQWNEENQKLGKLKQKFSDATIQAEKLQHVVEKVGAPEQIAAFVKLGTGMVGAFSGVQGAIGLLGGSSKTLDEIAAKGVMFMQIMGGMQAVAEVFSKETLAGLKGISSGFGTMLKSVKEASTGMKTALISTGIGALVVGVGLLISYWDDLSDMISGTSAKEKKNNEAMLDSAKSLTTEFQSIGAVLEKDLYYLKETNKQLTDNLDIAQKRHEIEKNNLDIINFQIDEEKALQVKLNGELEDSDAITKSKLETDIEISKNKVKLYETEKKLLKTKIEESFQYIKIADAIESIGNRIKKNSDQLIILNSLNDKQRAIYLNQLDTLNNQIDSINKIKSAGIQLTKAQINALDTYEAQRVALNNQEKERQRILKIELEQLGNDRKIASVESERVQRYMILADAIDQENITLEKNAKIYEDQVEFAQERNDLILDYLQRRKELNHFDSEGLKMFNEQNAELEKLVVNYDLIFKQNEDILAKRLEGKKVDQEKLQDGAKELSLFKLIKEAEIERLNNDNKLLQNQKESAKLTIEENVELQSQLQEQKGRLKNALDIAEAKYKAAKNDEERKTAETELFDIETKYNDISNQILESKRNITAANKEINTTEIAITDNTKKTAKANEEVAKKTEETANNIERQSTTVSMLQESVTEYSNEIQASQELLSNSIELIASLQDRKAEKSRERIAEYQKQLDELEEQEDERQNKLVQYEEELKDANGQRYDDLLAAIDEEKQAVEANAEEKLRLEEQIAKENRKRQEAERKAAQWRKAQAIIDATIQGALAVIKALPNVVLAAVVGAASAVGVATIVAQKIPPTSQFKEGGFTAKSSSDSDAVGIVHANEYVVPANVVRSSEAQQHIAALEAQRSRGYQTGGYVQPATTTPSESSIDYDRLINGIASAIRMLPSPEVSVVKIATGLNEVKVTKQNAGLTRG